MKKMIFYLLLLFPFYAIASEAIYTAIASLSKEITENISANSKLAVVELVDLDGYPNHLGKFIAEELISNIQLSNSKKITVIERRLLMKILDEQKMSISDLVEPAAIQNLGKLLGANQLVTGTLTELGQEVRINVRVISTKTAENLSVAQATIPITGAIEKLIKRKGKPLGTKSNNSENDIFTQQWKGFNFKLSSCSKVSTKIQCEMVITATKKDTVLSINRKTALFDNKGNEEWLKNIKHGNNFDQAMKNYSYLVKEFIVDVPVETTLSFNLADKDATQVAALKLKFTKPSGYVVFKNIPL